MCVGVEERCALRGSDAKNAARVTVSERLRRTGTEHHRRARELAGLAGKAMHRTRWVGLAGPVDCVLAGPSSDGDRRRSAARLVLEQAREHRVEEGGTGPLQPAGPSSDGDRGVERGSQAWVEEQGQVHCKAAGPSSEARKVPRNGERMRATA